MIAQALTQALRENLLAEIFTACVELHARNLKTAQEKLDGFSLNPSCEYILNINPTRDCPLTFIALNRAGKIGTDFARTIARKTLLGRTYWIRDWQLVPISPDQIEGMIGAKADYTPRTAQDRADRIFDQGTFHRPVQKYKGRLSVAEQASLYGYTAAQMRSLEMVREM